jgi:hypothetical protein
MGNIPDERVSRSITRHIDSLEHPDFQFSRCTGRKKAVCVSQRFWTVPNVALYS